MNEYEKTKRKYNRARNGNLALSLLKSSNPPTKRLTPGPNSTFSYRLVLNDRIKAKDEGQSRFYLFHTIGSPD